MRVMPCHVCFSWQEVQRDKAEQIEKARLRHKHALAQLQLEEVRNKNTFNRQFNS